MKPTIYISLFLCLLFPIYASCQKADSFSVSYANFGESNRSNVSLQKMKLQYMFDKRYFANGQMLFQNVEYASVNLKYANLIETPSALQQFSSLTYSVGTTHELKHNWRVTTVLSPTLYPNFEGKVTLNDFTVLGILYLERTFGRKKNFDLNVGIIYSNSLGVPTPLPYLNCKWRLDDKLTLDLGFPKTGVNYQVTRTTKVSSHLFIEGEYFHLGRNMAYDNTNTKINNIRLTNIGAGIKLKQELGRNIQVSINSGTTLRRTYRFNNGDKKVKDLDVENGFFACIACNYTI